MRSCHRWQAAALAVLGMGVLLVLGCGRSGSSEKAIEYRPLRFETGPAIDIAAVLSNASIAIRGEADRTETEITAILTATGGSLQQAQRRVEELEISVVHQGKRIGIRFEPPEEAAKWGELPTARFEVLTSNQGTIRVEAANGSVEVSDLDGDVAILTDRGSVDVRRASGVFEVDVRDGSMSFSDIAGRLTARAERGSAVIEGAVLEADVETRIGDISYAGTLAGSENRLVASYGGVSLRVPLASQLEVEAEVVTGQIESSLPFVGDVSGTKWLATLNAPTARVFLRSTNAWIRIEPLDNM